jgi:hypothetical protein
MSHFQKRSASNWEQERPMKKAETFVAEKERPLKKADKGTNELQHEEAYAGEVRGFTPLNDRETSALGASAGVGDGGAVSSTAPTGSSGSVSVSGSPSVDSPDFQPPYARFRTNRFDFSPYVQPSLMTSIDRLTSPTSLAWALVMPAVKIATKSLLSTGEPVDLRRLIDLTKLNPEKTSPEQPAADATVPPFRPSAHRRSLFERISYFFTVGLPMSLIFGILCGFRNLLVQIWSDFNTIVGTVLQLMKMGQSDYRYYSSHPDELPRTDIVADAAVAQVLMPNARRLIYDKLGYFRFIGRPIVNLLENRVRATVTKGVQKIEKMRGRWEKNKQNTNEILGVPVEQ